MASKPTSNKSKPPAKQAAKKAAKRRASTPAAPSTPPRRRTGQTTESTTVERKRAGELQSEREDNRQTPDPQVFDNPAHLTVGLSATKNLGNYESVRVNVSVTRPHEDTEEERDRIYDESISWCNEKIQSELAEEGA